MSASREKKQRQGAGPSEKALQARQQEAARKKKTVTYTVIGVVIAVLVAALLIWNSGFFQARAAAATVGDTKLSTAELSYYYFSARQSVAMYGSYLGFDTAKSDEEQMYDAENNKTYRDYFMETALSNAQWSAALSKQALAGGHTEADVKDDLNAQIDSAKSSAASYGYSYSAYLRAMYGPYMSAGVYEKVIRQILLANLASNDKSTELSDSYSEADLTAYYEKDDNADTLDTFEYSYLYFTPAKVETEDADGNEIDEDTVNKQKEEALADAKKNAEEALESLKDGGKPADLAKKYELADSAYADHAAVVGSGSISSVYQEKLLSLKEDESALVENGESGFYVITYHGRKLVEDPTKDVRHILIRAETTTDEDGNVVAPTDEAWAAAEDKINAIKAEYEAGEMTEDAFAALANEKSDDGDGTTGGLYTKIAESDNYVPEFLEWIFADGRKVGDTGIVKHEGDASGYNPYWGYHFIYLVGDSEPVWMRTARNTLTEEALTAWQEELQADFPTALAGGADKLGK